MGQITGHILLDGTIVGHICSRSEQLDETIRRGGIDPDEVNVATTPLIGASRTAEIVVLALMQPASGAGFRAFSDGVAKDILNNSATAGFAVHLWEPAAGSGGGSGTDTGDKPGPVTGPDITDVPVVDGPPPDIDEGPTRPAGDSGVGDPVERSSASATQVAASSTLQKMTLGRQLLWGTLTLVSARELLASVGAGNGYIQVDPGNPNAGGSLFVLTFADARTRLNGQTVWSMDTVGQKGETRDQWNMIADNPLHLVASTVKASTYQPAPVSGPVYRGTGTMTVSAMNGIPAPSAWQTETCYSAKEIIDAYVSQIGNTFLDRGGITYTYQAVALAAEKKGDMLNLDLRGRTIGEALDEVAGRIGCVWVWNRYASQLILRPNDYGITGGSASPSNVPLWIFWNGPFRTGGGFNQVTNGLPGRWATVHPVRYVSVYGRSDEDAVYVDWRSMATPEGTRHIDIASSDRPPLWYQIGSGTGRTQFVGDHVPAYYGFEGSKNTLPIGNVASSGGWNIWNERKPTTTTTASLWWAKSWAVSLAERLSTIEQRYVNTRRLIDGEVVLGRMPAYGLTQPMMNESPCPGLQWDEVRFGMGGQPLQYRLWGSNTDTLIFPHLVQPSRVKALGLGSSYQANGYVNLQRLEKRQGIVRTFLADVQQQTALKRDTTSSDPHVWLYAFKEVVPNNLADGSFLKGNPWGESNLAAEGRALNLCELAGGSTTVANTPTTNFDGGTLRYNPTGSQVKIVRASVRGICPCYEYITPSGMTVYFIAQNPGVQVICPGSTTPLLGTGWQNSGASGSAFADSVPLAGIVSELPVADRNVPIASEPMEQAP
jgi:hypothetical protein